MMEAGRIYCIAREIVPTAEIASIEAESNGA